MTLTEQHTKATENYNKATDDLREADNKLQEADKAYTDAKRVLVDTRAAKIAGDASKADVNKAEVAYNKAKEAFEQAEIHLEAMQRAVALFDDKKSEAFEQMQDQANQRLSEQASQHLADMMRSLDAFISHSEQLQSVRDEARTFKIRPDDVAPNPFAMIIREGKLIETVARNAYKSEILNDLSAESFQRFKDDDKWQKSVDDPRWQQKEWQEKLLSDQQAAHEAKMKAVAQVQKLKEQGKNITDIARQMRIEEPTVEAYLQY